LRVDAGAVADKLRNLEALERAVGKEKVVKIMHIEPSPSYREGLRKALAGSRYTVAKEASYGDEGLFALDSVRPDVVVMCINAPGHRDEPGGGGLELVKSFVNHATNPKVIVTHTIDTQYLVMNALRAGAAANARKPFRKDLLLEALGRAETSDGGKEAIRRRKVRLKTSLPVKYKRASDSFFRRMKSTYTSDISEEGAGILVHERIPEKTLLKVQIDVPGGGSVSTQAQVMRSPFTADRGMYDTGLAFRHMDPEDRERIRAYILKSVEGK
jgi:DNA-binding NarL/FixJ family response regulator